MKKFDYIVGNPAYQLDSPGEQKTFAPPVYHKFMDAAYEMGTVVELVTPGRFLFDAGSTPKAWNQKMLHDPHLKVLQYERDASKFFPNTEIKGGVVITYHDSARNYGPIGVFTEHKELHCILQKIKSVNPKAQSLTLIMYNQTRFDLESLYAKFPEYRSVIGSSGQDKRFRNNIFEKIDAFHSSPQTATDVEVWGVINNKRVRRYIPISFVDQINGNLSKWKVLLPAATGSGQLGEIFSTPLIVGPYVGFTQTFISIGAFDTKDEALNAEKYIKTKFSRAMLSILKNTQHNAIPAWEHVPLQVFTSDGDIDWSQSVADIDHQLYRKYGLSDDEIEFIETHVKEMV